MAPAARTRRRSSNTAEAPASPYKTSTGSARASKATTTTRKRGGDEAAGKAAAAAAGKTAFVTVGTTRFDALIRSVDSRSFESALLSRGFTRLVVQAGAGAHAPERLLGLSDERQKGKKAAATTAAPTTTTRFAGTTSNGLSVEFFDYAPTLRDHFAAADLVVTHAGAGSIFETLSMRSSAVSAASGGGGGGGGRTKEKKASASPSSAPIPLIAVPNGALMHNHQAELASELEARGLLVSATAGTLAEVLATADFSKLRRYEGGGVQGVVAAIDELSGRSGKKIRRR